MANTISMNVRDFVAFLKSIPATKASIYANSFPYNCLYNWGTYYSADCWNLIKATIWGQGTLPTSTGGYIYEPGKFGLGDWDAAGILTQCRNISSDFNNIPVGAFLYINNEHAGIYVGNFEKDGYTFNVVESTPIWENGIQYSFVAGNGARYNHRGGSVAGAWTGHALMPWIEYDTPTPTPSEKKTNGFSSGCLTVGDKVRVITPYIYGTKRKFVCYYPIYDVIEVINDRVVIGIGKVITAAINIKYLQKV